MPVFNWFKVNETGDLKYLFVDSNAGGFSPVMAKKFWRQLNNEYIRVFGLGDYLSRVVKKTLEIEKLRCQKIITGEESLQTMIEVREHELEIIRSGKTAGADFFETVDAIERYRRMPLDLHKTTVRMFYTYIRDLNKKAKKSHERRVRTH